MNAAIALVAVALSVVQADRRPLLTIVSQDSAALEVQVRWAPMTAPGGVVFARHEWEARDAANLIANGTAAAPQAAFAVQRPPFGDSLFIRVYVRGLNETGPGPWGWASDPLVVAGLHDQPERRPVLEIAEETAHAVFLAATWEPMMGPGQNPYPEYQWEARTPEALVAYGTVASPRASIAIARQNNAPTMVQVTVRGITGGTAGPWSFSSPTVAVPPISRLRVPELAGRAAPRQPTEQIPPERPRAPATPPVVPRPDPPVASTSAPARPGTHEPPGFSPLFQTPVATPAGGERQPDAPLSAPWVLPIVYPAGLAGGEVPWRRDLDLDGPATELYIRYAFKLDPRFEGHPSAANSVLAFAYGPVELVDIISGAGQSPLQYQIGLNGPRPACQLAKPAPRAQRLVPNREIVPLIRDRWYTVELQIQPGNPGACDGQVRAWFNGQLVMEYDDVGLGRPASPPFTVRGISVAPRWGTAGGVVENTFRLWIDEIYVSGR